MKRMASLLLLAVLAAGAAPARANQAPADTLVVPVPGVEVSALRGRDRLREIPAAAFVLSREDIQRAGSARLSTLLQSVPGLFAYGQTSGGDATIVDPRGFTASGESSYLKLLVDGQDVRDLENGNVDWDWVAPGDIERIEVVQGPGAWLYGDASEGGIVNVVRSPLRDRFDSQFNARGGSFGLRSADASVSGPAGVFNAGAVEVGARGFAREVDGWRTHSRERVYGGGGQASGHWGGRQWSVDASGLDANRQEPGALTAGDFAADDSRADSKIDYEHSRRGRFSARLQSAAGPEPSWALTPYGRIEDVDQVRTLFFQPQFHHTRGGAQGAAFETRTRATVAGRPVVVQGGAEFEYATLRSDYDQYDATTGKGPLVASTRGFRTDASASLGARMELDARTVARLSVRGDLARVRAEDGFAGTTSSTRSMSAVSPLLGLTRQVGAGGTVYGSVSTAFRVPTLFQLYDERPIFTGFNFISISNAQLDPQRSASVELGGRWERGRGASAQLGAYSTWVRDEIDFDLATLRYANISRSWHRGLEGRVECPLPAHLSARAGGAWTPTTFDGGDSDGRQINGVPLGTGSAALAWEAVPGVSAEAGARLIGRQFLDKDEKQRLGSVVAWDAGVQARTGRLQGGVRVLNVFGRKYPESGFIGAFGEQRLLPAAPRSVNVTLSYR